MYQHKPLHIPPYYVKVHAQVVFRPQRSLLPSPSRSSPFHMSELPYHTGGGEGGNSLSHDKFQKKYNPLSCQKIEPWVKNCNSQNVLSILNPYISSFGLGLVIVQCSSCAALDTALASSPGSLFSFMWERGKNALVHTVCSCVKIAELTQSYHAPSLYAELLASYPGPPFNFARGGPRVQKYIM